MSIYPRIICLFSISLMNSCPGIFSYCWDRTEISPSDDGAKDELGSIGKEGSQDHFAQQLPNVSYDALMESISEDEECWVHAYDGDFDKNSILTAMWNDDGTPKKGACLKFESFKSSDKKCGIITHQDKVVLINKYREQLYILDAYDQSLMSNANLLVKSHKHVYIVLPYKAQINLFNPNKPVISGLDSGDLGYVPIYIRDYDANCSYAFTNRHNQNGMFFSSDAVYLCLWDNRVEQFFIKRIGDIPGIEDLFKGITVSEVVIENSDRPFAIGIGTLDDKRVKVCKIGKQYFVLNKNLDSMLAEYKSEAELSEAEDGVGDDQTKDSYLIGAENICADTDCYPYKADSNEYYEDREKCALGTIWGPDGARKKQDEVTTIKFKQFMESGNQYNSAIISHCGRIYIVSKKDHTASIETLSCYHSFIIQLETEKMNKNDMMVCVVLPNNLKIDLYSNFISTLPNGYFKCMPKYDGSENGFGYVPIADASKYHGKKMVYFNNFGMCWLLLWDPIFEKTLIKGVSPRDFDISRLFTGVRIQTAKVIGGGYECKDYNNFMPAVGELNNKQVRVCRVGTELIVLSKDPNGPIFAEKIDDAMEFKATA